MLSTAWIQSCAVIMQYVNQAEGKKGSRTKW